MFDRFADGYYLWLLLLIPIFLLLYWKRRDRKGATLKFSSLTILKQIQTPFWLRHLPFLLRCLVLGLLIVVLARPQSSATREEILSEESISFWPLICPARCSPKTSSPIG